MEESKPEGHRELIAVAQQVVERLKPLIVLGLIIEIALSSLNFGGSFDLPWQLAEGDSILKNGIWSQSSLHSYGELSPHFQNEYILYELLITGIDHTLGWIGLCLFFSLLGFLIYGPCLPAFIRSRRSFMMIDLCLVILAQPIIGLGLTARPELVAMICYVCAGIMLLRCDELPWSGWRTFCFGLIFCLWANAHGSFLIGGAMLTFWYAQLLLFHAKDISLANLLSWSRPGLAALVGCALNPYGIFRFSQPFQLHSLLWGQATSAEMWPVTPVVALLLVNWTAVPILTVIMRLGERKQYWLIPLLMLLLPMTFESFRYILFIALTFLIIAWDGLSYYKESPSSERRLLTSLSRLLIYLIVAFGLIYSIGSLISKKWTIIANYRNTIQQARVTTSSAFTWLTEHPSGHYFILSNYGPESCSQMPGINGIHPLMDSGSHRYSDRLIQLFYYSEFSPAVFRFTLSELKINAVVVESTNIYWAAVLNGSPDWHLVHIESDSQLYLRTASPESNSQIFSHWEQDNRRDKTDVTSEDILRGLRARPDAESLRLLVTARDVTWMSDPPLSYVQDWLDQVPPPQVSDALKTIGNRTDDAAKGLRILLFLRSKQDAQAADVAQDWKPSYFDPSYQHFQLVRAEAFLADGDGQKAQKVVQGLWPQPRFSLRWAKLCQQADADPKTLPKNARLLVGVAEDFSWQKDLIATLNQNILRISNSSP